MATDGPNLGDTQSGLHVYWGPSLIAFVQDWPDEVGAIARQSCLQMQESCSAPGWQSRPGMRACFGRGRCTVGTEGGRGALVAIRHFLQHEPRLIVNRVQLASGARGAR